MPACCAKALRLLLAAALVLAGAGLQAQPVVDLASRDGVTERLLVLQPPAVQAVLVLLPGGNGRVGVGVGPDGSLERPGNFLVRSRELFARQGYAVLVPDVPSDRQDLDGDFRESPAHIADLGAAVAWARQQFGKPVWLVGTSRGTQSAVAAALSLRDAEAPDGLVLTSTILDRNPRSAVTARPVPEMDVAQLKIPVLVVHHAQDPCNVTRPARLPVLMAKLPPASSELLVVSGGRSVGPPCEARSYHGYNGIEDSVVAAITRWVGEHR